ncbi:CDP-archaeol synthase [Candidatus Gottesmanbacteria bacterium]|nr:CDP-archaeol synthase [Candidatus Gottesmanbacteria bacterium]
MSFYFYFPAALANMGAVISFKIPLIKNLDYPIDFGLRFWGKRLVGEHKKIGGFIYGLFCGIFWGSIKFIFLDPIFKNFVFFYFSFWENLWFYFLLSLGALLGDLTKSIIKRLLNIAPHKMWIPFDEIDHTVGAILLVFLFYPISLSVIITTIGLYFFLHLITNVIGYKLGLKKVPY